MVLENSKIISLRRIFVKTKTKSGKFLRSNSTYSTKVEYFGE